MPPFSVFRDKSNWFSIDNRKSGAFSNSSKFKYFLFICQGAYQNKTLVKKFYLLNSYVTVYMYHFRAGTCPRKSIHEKTNDWNSITSMIIKRRKKERKKETIEWNYVCWGVIVPEAIRAEWFVSNCVIAFNWINQQKKNTHNSVDQEAKIKFQRETNRKQCWKTIS